MNGLAHLAGAEHTIAMFFIHYSTSRVPVNTGKNYLAKITGQNYFFLLFPSSLRLNDQHPHFHVEMKFSFTNAIEVSNTTTEEIIVM